PLREAHDYPPVGAMIRIVVRGKMENTTLGFAQHLADRLQESAESLSPAPRVLGPATAPIAKLRNQHRYHLQLHGGDSELLRRCVRRATEKLEAPNEVLWTIDVDPLDML